MALYNVIKRTIQTTAGLRDGLTIVEPDRMTRLCYYILYSATDALLLQSPEKLQGDLCYVDVYLQQSTRERERE